MDKPRRFQEVPIAMSLSEVDSVLEESSAGKELAARFARDIVNEGLTPLQAQAVLAAAWNRALTYGRLSPPAWDKRDLSPERS